MKKYDRAGPTFKLWKVSLGPTFTPGVPGPTFKHWERVSGPGVLVPRLYLAETTFFVTVNIYRRYFTLHDCPYKW